MAVIETGHDLFSGHDIPQAKDEPDNKQTNTIKLLIMRLIIPPPSVTVLLASFTLHAMPYRTDYVWEAAVKCSFHSGRYEEFYLLGYDAV